MKVLMNVADVFIHGGATKSFGSVAKSKLRVPRVTFGFTHYGSFWFNGMKLNVQPRKK